MARFCNVDSIANSKYLCKVVAKMMENAIKGDRGALQFIRDNLHAPRPRKRRKNNET